MTLESLAAAIRRVDTRLARIESALTSGRRDDDAWTRIPNATSRCPVSNWSGRTLYRHIAAGRIRSKTVGKARFYAAADVAALISQPNTPTPRPTA